LFSKLFISKRKNDNFFKSSDNTDINNINSPNNLISEKKVEKLNNKGISISVSERISKKDYFKDISIKIEDKNKTRRSKRLSTFSKSNENNTEIKSEKYDTYNKQKSTNRSNQ